MGHDRPLGEEQERDKPWRRNAPNELIVNSILAATSAIVVQTIVANQQPSYGVTWLVAGLASLILFLISTEQLAESMREDEIDLWIRSTTLYNLGVILLIASLWEIFRRHVENLSLSVTVGMVLVLIAIWFWGFDAAFLIRRNEHYRRWKRKMSGEQIDEVISDYRDMLVVWIKSSLVRVIDK